MNRFIILAVSIIALCGFTYGYKNNLQTGKPDLVVTGVASVDIPTLNQNTTGSAATLTTARTINGVSFNGSANIQTATANTSDYATGTFTPTISFGGASVGVTYGTQLGQYTVIGNVVMFNLRVVLTSKGTSTGGVVIAGLPYVANIGVSSYPPSSLYLTGVATALAALHPQSFISPNTSTVTMYKIVSGTESAMLDTDCTNTTAINISGHYLK